MLLLIMALNLNKNPHGKYPSFGHGKEIVYIYYYDTYRYVSEAIDKESMKIAFTDDINKLKYFPCKVGKTIDLFNRLRQQNAAMPEEPIIPFIIKTSWSSELEILLHQALYFRTISRKWITDLSGGGYEWFLTNPREILKEAVRFKQTEKGAKEILEEYHAYRTNWNSELIDRFKHYFPEIENPSPLDLLLKTDKETETRRKKYGQYVPPLPPPPILPKANLYTDEELYDLQKNNLKEYEKLMKRYEKENPKKQPF